MEEITCPICETPNIKIVWEKPGEETIGSIVHPLQIKTVSCPVCGIYSCRSRWLEDSGWFDHFQERQDGVKYSDGEWLEKKALIRYHIWKDAPHLGTSDEQAFLERLSALWKNGPHPTGPEPFCPLQITEKCVWDIRDKDFPTPMEQVNYLVRFLGDKTRRLGGTYQNKFDSDEVFPVPELLKEDSGNPFVEQAKADEKARNDANKAKKTLLSATASVDGQNLEGVIATAVKSGFVEKNTNSLSLTIQGWAKYEELKKGRSDSSDAFLAMQFGGEHEVFLRNALKPCLEQTGLNLETLPEVYSDENTIDNKLRNAIRDSRILICDLTHRNNGAYFEAGLAEGLGKPVIYVCEQSSFDEHEENKGKDGDRSKRLHFDVEHQEIYRWKNGDDESIKKFQSDITAKIQAVL
jgi:hypothetical protein